MGAKVSTTIGSFSHRELLEKTQTTRALMDTIFNFLVKELNMKDYYVMSSPKECSKYVVAMANTLNTILYQLKMTPERSDKGVIYFRKIDDMAKPPSEKEQLQRHSLCIILSYFYTRIFQIFGALALSIVDDAGAVAAVGVAGPGAAGPGGIAMPPIMVAPGERGVIMRGGSGSCSGSYGCSGSGSCAATMGGAAGDKAAFGLFDFMRPALEMKYIGGQKKYKFIRNIGEYGAEFIPEVSEGGIKEQTGIHQVAEIRIDARNSRRELRTLVIKLRAHIYSPLTSDDIVVEFRNYRLSGSTARPVDIAGTTDIGAKIELQRVAKYDSYIDKESGQMGYTSVVDIARRVLSAASLSGYLDSAGTDLKGYGAADYYGRDYYGDRPRERLNMRTDIPEIDSALKINRVYTTMINQKNRPIAYCISRAMQLISSDAISDQKAKTNICKNSFRVEHDGMGEVRIKTAVPDVGESFNDSAALAAFSQLFFDTVNFAQPKVVQSTGELQKFLADMRTIMGSGQGAAETLKDVKMSATCDGSAGTIATVPKGVTPAVYQVVRALYERQLRHTAFAGVIFSRLFLIQRNRRTGETMLQIHPNIFRGGLRVLQEINIQTRNVLADYYKSCEGLYRKGVSIIKDGIEADKKETTGRAAAAAEAYLTLKKKTDAAAAAVAAGQKGPAVIPSQQPTRT